MKRKKTDTDLIHACMYDMLCLLGCGVNGTIPPKALLEKYRTENRTCGEEPEAAQERQLYLYRVSQAHFVDALTGTVLKQGDYQELYILNFWLFQAAVPSQAS